MKNLKLRKQQRKSKCPTCNKYKLIPDGWRECINCDHIRGEVNEELRYEMNKGDIVND